MIGWRFRDNEFGGDWVIERTGENLCMARCVQNHRVIVWPLYLLSTKRFSLLTVCQGKCFLATPANSSAYCIGCGRTKEEIMFWTALSEEQKRETGRVAQGRLG